MLSRIFFALILVPLLVACHGNDSSNNVNKNVTSVKMSKDSFLLERIITDFLSNDRVKSNIITLQAIKNNDTVKFIMMDSYPSLDEDTYIGYSNIKNRKVCILGDSIPPGFIKIDSRDVPIEVLDRIEVINNSKKLVMENVDFVTQSVCFKEKNLIKCP